MAVMARARQRVVHRSALADQADGVREIVVARAPALDRVFPERALRLVAARLGEDDGQRHLALSDIVAGLLAHRLGVGHVIYTVVDQPQTDTEVADISTERGLGGLHTPRRNPGP